MSTLFFAVQEASTWQTDYGECVFASYVSIPEVDLTYLHRFGRDSNHGSRLTKRRQSARATHEQEAA